MSENNDETIVKNIVISGGGIGGFSFYGAIKQLNINDVWNINNIQNIFGTSIGSIITVMLALKYNWEELDDYILKRPWQRVFKFNFSDIFNAIENRGIFNPSVMYETISPLLLGKGLDANITMKDFYDFTGINCHIICTELHSMNLINISHSTHPDWKLIDAVYCSCALPIIFSPFIFNNFYYCDGGFVCNFPIDICLNLGNLPKETIAIGFGSTVNIYNNSSSLNLFDYILTLLYNLINSVNKQNNIPLFKEIRLDPSLEIFHHIYDCINDYNCRKKLIDIGIDFVNNDNN